MIWAVGKALTFLSFQHENGAGFAVGGARVPALQRGLSKPEKGAAARSHARSPSSPSSVFSPLLFFIFWFEAAGPGRGGKSGSFSCGRRRLLQGKLQSQESERGNAKQTRSARELSLKRGGGNPGWNRTVFRKDGEGKCWDARQCVEFSPSIPPSVDVHCKRKSPSGCCSLALDIWQNILFWHARGGRKFLLSDHQSGAEAGLVDSSAGREKYTRERLLLNLRGLLFLTPPFPIHSSGAFYKSNACKKVEGAGIE